MLSPEFLGNFSAQRRKQAKIDIGRLKAVRIGSDQVIDQGTQGSFRRYLQRRSFVYDPGSVDPGHKPHGR